VVAEECPRGASATAGADAVQLRCWWARPAATPAKAAVLVLT
jgi:hypothetical protein